MRGEGWGRVRGWEWGGVRGWGGMRSEKVLWEWVKRKEMDILVCSVAVGVLMHHEKVVYVCRH